MENISVTGEFGRKPALSFDGAPSDELVVEGVPSKERKGLRPNSPVTEMFSIMSFFKGFSEAARQSRRMK